MSELKTKIARFLYERECLARNVCSRDVIRHVEPFRMNRLERERADGRVSMALETMHKAKHIEWLRIGLRMTWRLTDTGKVEYNINT